MSETHTSIGHWTTGLVGLFLLAMAGGCEEETLGPETRGTMEGRVRDAETNGPVADARVTTSPPTQSVLTADDGRFAFADVPTGSYTVEAIRSGYETGTATVTVPRGDTVQATVVLERDATFEGTDDSLAVDVLDVYNDPVNRDSTGADSVFVTAEYRARNAGTIRILDYEIYFTIQTSSSTFSQEESGDTLDVGEANARRFRKYIRDEQAESVDVYDVYVEPAE